MRRLSRDTRPECWAAWRETRRATRFPRRCLYDVTASAAPRRPSPHRLPSPGARSRPGGGAGCRSRSATIHMFRQTHLSLDVRPRVSEFPVTSCRCRERPRRFGTQLTGFLRKSGAPASHLRGQAHHEKRLQIEKVDPVGRLRVTGVVGHPTAFVSLRKPSVGTAGTRRHRLQITGTVDEAQDSQSLGGRKRMREGSDGGLVAYAVAVCVVLLVMMLIGGLPLGR